MDLRRSHRPQQMMEMLMLQMKVYQAMLLHTPGWEMQPKLTLIRCLV